MPETPLSPRCPWCDGAPTPMSSTQAWCVNSTCKVSTWFTNLTPQENRDRRAAHRRASRIRAKPEEAPASPVRDRAVAVVGVVFALALVVPLPAWGIWALVQHVQDARAVSAFCDRWEGRVPTEAQARVAARELIRDDTLADGVAKKCRDSSLCVWAAFGDEVTTEVNKYWEMRMNTRCQWEYRRLR